MYYLISLMIVAGMSSQVGPVTGIPFETLAKCEDAKKTLYEEADKKGWRMTNHVIFCAPSGRLDRIHPQ